VNRIINPYEKKSVQKKIKGFDLIFWRSPSYFIECMPKNTVIVNAFDVNAFNEVRWRNSELYTWQQDTIIRVENLPNTCG